MRMLAVYINDRPVGLLREGETLWSFDYDPEWAAAPDGFDLSPALVRAKLKHDDGGTLRPVQWYFDNLLPEELLREAIQKEAGINGDDAFALLEYLGAESAGSLTLLPPGQALPQDSHLLPLTDAALSKRIDNLPRVTLSHGSPKQMSVPGAQNKLLVVYRDNALFEPEGAFPSTHILKPNHLSNDYAASVINEYFTMRLADALGLVVPAVRRRYTPQPVYLIDRFDRYLATPRGPVQRRHIIDACQLLNKARSFKYTSATLDALREIIDRCRNRSSTRRRLFQWLVFNTLIANHDTHLKNLSFTVSAEGISLAPHYDLLSTGVYHTRALANERANWPAVELAIELPGATTFATVTRKALLEAGAVLKLPAAAAERELDRMAKALPEAVAQVIHGIEAENAQLPEGAARFLGGESRLLRAIEHIIVPDMLAQVKKN